MKIKEKIDENGITWFCDKNGNKCSEKYFGNKEKAIVALKSLMNCENCINCTDCTDCTGCYTCYDCTDCTGCSRCSGCSRCYDCSYCYDCTDCTGCSYCYDCTGCTDCSDCSRCSGCSRCYDCYSKKENFKHPEIPIIENIHQKILFAVSQPNAFDMGTWHTCETTHCRAGWVVVLAGEAGKELEKFYNTPLAAQLIYKASSKLRVSPVRFYEKNEVAMADIKRMAELEKEQELNEHTYGYVTEILTTPLSAMGATATAKEK